MLQQAEAWLPSVPGASIAGRDPRRVVVELPSPDTDEQALLHTALRSGPITEFTPVQPTLSELFRGVVSADPGAENQRAKDVA